MYVLYRRQRKEKGGGFHLRGLVVYVCRNTCRKFFLKIDDGAFVAIYLHGPQQIHIASVWEILHLTLTSTHLALIHHTLREIVNEKKTPSYPFSVPDLYR